MRSRSWLAVVAGPALALLSASPALAYSFSVGPSVLASVTNPFAHCRFGDNPGATPPSVNYPNAEVEPFIAVNPTNPSNLVGVYQQDRWSDGGAHGLMAAKTSNGGASWSDSFASFSACSGNTGYDRASDPWVTFDPLGNAFQISLSISADEQISAVLVSKSTDGGASWSSPVTLQRDTDGLHFNDKESITADPTRSGYVYAVWDRGTFPSDNRNPRSFVGSHAYRGQPMISRSTDGGVTWSPAVGMSTSNIFTIGNQVAVLPDGTLVDTFENFRGSGVQPSDNSAFEAVMLSGDAGLSWSEPIKIANNVFVGVRDPDTGFSVRAGVGLPDIAVDPNSGAIYVVWADGTLGDGAHTNAVMSSSTDGGHKWSAPAKVNQSPAGVSAFTPAVAVSSDSTLGVSYYDFRNNTPAAGVPTDAWMVHSHNAGASWAEDHLMGSFDIETAPVARGYFLGDYEGLTAVGKDFVAFFVATNSGNTHNRTDVFSVRLTAP